MRLIISYFLLSIVFVGCSKTKKDWQLKKEIKLDNVGPIGLAFLNDQLWLSDGDNNRLVQINEDGKIEKELADFDRPMHIAVSENTILIPEYGRDTISTYTGGKKGFLSDIPKLDAPAGVFTLGKEMAIANFYTNMVHFFNGTTWLQIGGKGTAEGKFNYPTDVHITKEFIFVADAYNHRVQVFDKSGHFVKVLGQNLGINAATGIYVADKELFITDFENSRVFVVSLENELIQEITQAIGKPTDMLICKEQLYVVNYKSGIVSVYER